MLASFYMHDMSWGWALLMTIGWIAVLALIIGGLWTLTRDRRRESPTDVLKQRLATGEISIDEYDRLIRTLSGPGTSPPAAA